MAYKDLSIRERAAVIKTAVSNGITTLPEIKEAYNKFDEGGQQTRDWDNTLTGKLINYVENSDSIGYQNGRWYAPTLKGYDPNQFGMGVDRNQTEGFSSKVKTDKQGKQYLTEEDERALRFQKIEQANTSANKRYEYAQKATNHPHGTISKVKDAAVVSAIYNLGRGTVANGLFNDTTFMNNLFDGTDAQVINRINEEYAKKGRNERIAKTNEILGNNKANGGYLFEDGGKLHSTGGPMYPFSFSKQGIPQVRY